MKRLFLFLSLVQAPLLFSAQRGIPGVEYGSGMTSEEIVEACKQKHPGTAKSVAGDMGHDGVCAACKDAFEKRKGPERVQEWLAQVEQFDDEESEDQEAACAASSMEQDEQEVQEFPHPISSSNDQEVQSLAEKVYKTVIKSRDDLQILQKVWNNAQTKIDATLAAMKEVQEMERETPEQLQQLGDQKKEWYHVCGPRPVSSAYSRTLYIKKKGVVTCLRP